MVSGADVAKRPKSVVVVLTEDAEEGGYFLDAYDRDGRPTTATTWHGGRVAASNWAATEHAPADIGAWQELPDSIRDAATYARREAGRTR